MCYPIIERVLIRLTALISSMSHSTLNGIHLTSFHDVQYLNTSQDQSKRPFKKQKITQTKQPLCTMPKQKSKAKQQTNLKNTTLPKKTIATKKKITKRTIAKVTLVKEYQPSIATTHEELENNLTSIQSTMQQLTLDQTEPLYTPTLYKALGQSAVYTHLQSNIIYKPIYVYLQSLFEDDSIEKERY